jgi:NADH dehydrogenase [ubiquinone] 1 alpha subcomplex assembly factor 7
VAGPHDSLTGRLARTIAHLGPIPLAQYMAEANAHYYAHRDPLGVTGDFVTAPEISQMFGEMLGGWLADMAVRAGSHDACYVELGGGRGTLARDALRVMAGAGLRPEVHLVEASPVLREAQRSLLAEHAPVFHDSAASLPEDRPLLIVANEFFDALPIGQLVRTPRGWREMVVALGGTDADEPDARSFVPVPGDRPMDSAIPPARADAPADTLIEVCPAASAIMHELGGRLARQGGAMLALDYGHLQPFTGSSLQAVRAHRKVDPFTDPGAADLTAHVDFAALADAARAAGCRVDGMAQQGEFLLALGIAQRAAALARANPASAGTVAEALDRLVSARAMGSLFKVLALAAPGWPQGAGLAHAPS